MTLTTGLKVCAFDISRSPDDRCFLRGEDANRVLAFLTSVRPCGCCERLQGTYVARDPFSASPAYIIYYDETHFDPSSTWDYEENLLWEYGERVSARELQQFSCESVSTLGAFIGRLEIVKNRASNFLEQTMRDDQAPHGQDVCVNDVILVCRS